MMTRGQLSHDGRTCYAREYTPGQRVRPDAIRRVACPVRVISATLERIDAAAHNARMTRTQFVENAILDALEVAEFDLSGLCNTKSSQQ